MENKYLLKRKNSNSYKPAEVKIFIELVVLIVRNRIWRKTKECLLENGIKRIYLDVPAAIRELEKIGMIRYSDYIYPLSKEKYGAVVSKLKNFRKRRRVKTEY